MVDPGTGLAILGGSALSKSTVERMLGPTADYIGEGLRNWTERRVENVQRVFRKAHNSYLRGHSTSRGPCRHES